jgi:hypothetical protein
MVVSSCVSMWFRNSSVNPLNEVALNSFSFCNLVVLSYNSAVCSLTSWINKTVCLYVSIYSALRGSSKQLVVVISLRVLVVKRNNKVP